MQRSLRPPPSLPPAVALLPLLALYAVVQAVRLDQAPLINPDEAAYTEPAWTLLTSGRFGAPMYAGMLGIEDRWYFLWPGYAVLAVLPYALLGPDLLAVRILSVLFGALLLCAVWLLTYEVTSCRPPAGPPTPAGPSSPATSGVYSASPHIPAGASSPAAQRVRAAGHLTPDILGLCAAALTMLHPTVFSLSRFGRPEIAVTALTLLSSALAARSTRLHSSRWAFAAGAAAALAFLMHQYGGLALLGLLTAFLLRPPSTWRHIRPLVLATAAGALLALVPWLLWIGSDFPEFRAQLGVQLDYQRWRYPDASAPRSLLRDLPGRYLLNRQDYPPGWQPWSEAVTLLLGPRFLQGPTEPAPLPLLKWGASVPLYWQQLGVSGLYRWGVLGALLLALTLSPFALKRNDAALRWVLLPLLVWALALAAIPNKWEGYTGPVAAYTAVALTLLLAHSRRAWSASWPRTALVSAVALCVALWVAADLRLLTAPPPAYAPFAERLRQAVPPGEQVAIPMREWFAFAGRNPAVTYEFRSVPAFRTSVLEMLSQQRPRYLVLHRTDGQPQGERRYHFINPPWDDLNAFLDDQTDLVATVQDEVLGTVEVRRIREHPSRP